MGSASRICKGTACVRWSGPLRHSPAVLHGARFELPEDHGGAEFVGYSSLAFASLKFVAAAAATPPRRAGEPISATNAKRRARRREANWN